MKKINKIISIAILLVVLFFLKNQVVFGQSDKFKKGLTAYDSKEYANSIELLLPFANSGNCIAQYVVGLVYSNKKIKMYNDSLAIHYLLKASEQKQTHAMGILASLYFGKSNKENGLIIEALVWAELAAEYDFIQKGLTTRHIIRKYMNENEIEKAEKILKDKILEYNNIESCQ